jgi:hypothetical protein
MDVLTQVVVWLSGACTAVGGVLLAPVGLLPGWLSLTLVSAATGLVMLVAFKYTSPQRAILAVRNDLKAHLLALKLFKDSPGVTLRAQDRVFRDAFALLALAIPSMLVLALPMLLAYRQLALWYDARPLHAGEEAVVTVKLAGEADSSWPEMYLEPTDDLEVTAGPLRILSRREVCWEIKARTPGYHRLRFQVAGQAADKELAVGEDFMQVSPRRPEHDAGDVLWNPAEEPFATDSPVRWIEIDYPKRSGWYSGSTADVPQWVIWWLIVSMIAALCWRWWVKVHI